MKRTITPLLCAIIMVLAGFGVALAQPGTYYKKHHVNENFDEGVLPSGWIQTNQNANDANSAVNPAAIFARSGGQGLKNGMYNWVTLSSGNQFRGADLRFPSTSSNPEFTGEKIWNIEFDWYTVNATLSHGNALSLILCGTNSINIRDGATWYADAILGIFIMGDNKFHYWNQDLIGYPKPDATGTPIPGEFMGPAFLAGQYPNFNRVWSTSTATSGINVDSTWKANSATLTDVTYAHGKTYHIQAELNFTTQKVVSLTITDKEDPLNTATILDKPFLAPTTAGSASTVPVENRIVQNLSIINVGDNRSTNSGNVGGGSIHDTYIDNLEVYVMVESQGKADLTVRYIDTDGATVKDNRVMSNQEVGNIYRLLTADKDRVVTETNYYAYNADLTHAANTRGADGESITLDLDGDTLFVVFKKSPKTEGTYVWTGSSNGNWDEISNNFSVNNGAAQSYQSGNTASFSKADAAVKDVAVTGTIDLGDKDINVEATGYTFAGIGKLIGTGSVSVFQPTTLGFDNRLTGGVKLLTADTVKITSAAAGVSYQALTESVNMKLTPGANFSTPITGTNGTLTLTTVSNVGYWPAITGLTTVNINLATVGRETGNSWTNPFTTAFESGTQVNVIDATFMDTITTYNKYRGATYAINNNSLSVAKVHLGDNTRIILNTSPLDNNTASISIGELTGTSSSSIQGNCVSSNYIRIIEYAIGGLNTDATFNGSIIPQLTREPARRSGTEKVWERLTVPGDTVWYSPSTLKVKKVGTGKWTLGGKIIIPDAISPSTLTVSAGTMVLGDSIVAPGVNIMTATVDAPATLKANGNFVGMYNININGTLEDGIKAGANLTINKGATVKLDVTNFTDTYESIEAAGDLKADSATLEISVANTPVVGAKVVLLTSSNSDIRFRTVTVNGTPIISNGIPVSDQAYVWVYDAEEFVFTGELQYVGPSGIKPIVAKKAIKDIKYFDVTGRPVARFVEGVILIKKTTYTDGSVSTDKVYKERK